MSDQPFDPPPIDEPQEDGESSPEQARPGEEDS